MDKVQFQAYAIPFPAGNYDTAGLPPDVKLSHTFVVSPSYNWNCFGRGKLSVGEAMALPSGKGATYEEWANNIYGPYSGEQYEDQAYPAAGVTVRVNGVCHNAANRILALTGGDVSDADGNAIVMLMYGKYGFGIPKYIQLVKDAAQKVNAEAGQTVIPPEEVNVVVARITNDPTQEVDTLENEMMRTHFEEELNAQNFTPDEVDKVKAVYADFEVKRQQVFDETQAAAPNDIASLQGRYGQALKPVLMSCLQDMLKALGETKYLEMFQVDPETAIKFLLQ